MKVFFFLLSVFFMACSFNAEHSHNANSTKKKALTESEAQITVYALPKYDVDEILTPVLDEIIKDQNSCIVSAFKNTGFSLTIEYFDSYTDLYFFDIDLDRMSLGEEIGCFIHSDKIFLIDIPQSGRILFYPLNDTLRISSDYVRIKQEIPMIDDSGSSWLYRIENNTIIHLVCKNLDRRFR